MSPDYPRQGNYYVLNESAGKYETAQPEQGTDLSAVPVMNRAARRRAERDWQRAYPPSARKR